MAGLLLIILLGKQPQYLTEANLMMRMRDDKVFNFDKVVDNTGGESNSILYMLNNHRVEMKSRRFLNFFFTRLAPTEQAAFVAPPVKPTLVSKVFESLSSAPPAINGTAEDRSKAAFMILCETVGVDFIKETMILKVSVKHHSAEQAANLANSWVKAYVEYVGHEDGASTRAASTFLRQEAEQAKQRVQASEEKLAAYCREKGLVADEEQSAGDSEKLRLLSAEQAHCEIELAQVKQNPGSSGCRWQRRGKTPGRGRILRHFLTEHIAWSTQPISCGTRRCWSSGICRSIHPCRPSTKASEPCRQKFPLL